MGSLAPDEEVAETADERLCVGRLGQRFAKRAFDIIFSAVDRRLPRDQVRAVSSHHAQPLL